jgi:hypothetical protein
MAMRYEFNLATYVRRPLVIDRRGGMERDLNVIMAGSRGRKAVTYESDVSEGVQVTVLFYIKNKLSKLS